MENQFYILATSSLADDRTRVLKHNDTFAVFDRYGDIQPVGLGEQGLYQGGTRFISRLMLSLCDTRPLLLSSTVSEDNGVLLVDLMNPDVYLNGESLLSKGTLHIVRSKFLWQGVCYERIIMSNYDRKPVTVGFSLEFDADFADIFEVRGMKRQRRGRRQEPVVNAEQGTVILSYEGLDGVLRQTGLQFLPRPRSLSGSEAYFETWLQSKGMAEFVLAVSCQEATPSLPAYRGGRNGAYGASPLSPQGGDGRGYDQVFMEASRALEAAKREDCAIHTSSEQFNDWLERSSTDLHMMVTETPHGLYPYAGTPWFNTVFGRDGIITALEALWANPHIARGVLSYLAATQARRIIPEQEAEPGKIIHEVRGGEMAAVGEIPFGHYYGSVDATPLFVALAGAYYERTGDRLFIDAIWPNIELALKWIDNYGDLDRDGFIEYRQRSPKGLVNQGWKDSHDAVFHADGTLAVGPMALCEAQGYVYLAKRMAAELALVLGHKKRASELLYQANVLQQRFEHAFWSDELSTYILALDGRKQPCRVRTSNAGHLLFTGIASQEHAQRTAQTLMQEDSFSGWGIRTLSSAEVKYNPMSYHNGSIWPHDNALIAYGMGRYGLKEAALKVLNGLFDASIAMDLHRLPELFCGFPRRRGEGPTLYPIACSPQSWASASVFILLGACLGISIRGVKREVHFSHPVLPEALQEVQIRNLQVGSASVDLSVERYPEDVSINVTRRAGNVQVVVVK